MGNSNTDLERAFYIAAVGVTDAQAATMSFSALRAAYIAMGTGGGSANTLGTFSNPITNVSAARPAGLTRVVFDTVTDPVNWAIGDFNLQYGT